MYYFLTEAAVNRIIYELREYWKYHPKYRDDLVNNIQGKYSFAQRPQHGIIVKMGGASRTRLAADNFMGTTYSYVYHQKVHGFNGTSVEWVREDAVAIQNNGGDFPTLPGIYYVTVTEEDAQTGVLTFEVEALVNVIDEIVAMTDSTHGVLQNPYVEGSLRLFWMPSSTPLTEGEGYTADASTGEIELFTPLQEGTFLYADYRYDGGKTGPWYVKENYAHNQAIPGAAIAFGRRGFVGDRFAVIVSERREPSYLMYGGRWDLTIDCEVMSRDVHTQREIHDASVMYVMSVLRSRLCDEGIEVSEVSPGGESEEIYDDNADDYFYNASFSISMTTDWRLQVPIERYIRAALPMSYDDFSSTATLTDEEVAQVQSNIRMVDSLGLRSFRDPFFLDRTQTFEMVR